MKLNKKIYFILFTISSVISVLMALFVFKTSPKTPTLAQPLDLTPQVSSSQLNPEVDTKDSNSPKLDYYTPASKDDTNPSQDTLHSQAHATSPSQDLRTDSGIQEELNQIEKMLDEEEADEFDSSFISELY